MGEGLKKMSDYKQRAENILKEAIAAKEGSRKEGYNDNKRLVNLEELTALIYAGGRIVNLNSEMTDHRYIHEVLYKEHKFMVTTPNTIDIEIPDN